MESERFEIEWVVPGSRLTRTYASTYGAARADIASYACDRYQTSIDAEGAIHFDSGPCEKAVIRKIDICDAGLGILRDAAGSYERTRQAATGESLTAFRELSQRFAELERAALNYAAARLEAADDPAAAKALRAMKVS